MSPPVELAPQRPSADLAHVNVRPCRSNAHTATNRAKGGDRGREAPPCDRPELRTCSQVVTTAPILALAAGTPGEPPYWLARDDLGLFVVASPLGSDDAVPILFESLLEHAATLPGRDSRTPGSTRTTIAAAYQVAAVRLQRRIVEHPELGGVGATCVVLALSQTGAVISHIGDCRAYLFRQGRVAERTTDHSLTGRPTILVRALGMADSVPEFQFWEFGEGDACLLSAELHSHLSDGRIREIVVGEPVVSVAVSRLIDEALCAGARGVVTGVLVRA